MRASKQQANMQPHRKPSIHLRLIHHWTFLHDCRGVEGLPVVVHEPDGVEHPPSAVVVVELALEAQALGVQRGCLGESTRRRRRRQRLRQRLGSFLEAFFFSSSLSRAKRSIVFLFLYCSHCALSSFDLYPPFSNVLVTGSLAG